MKKGFGPVPETPSKGPATYTPKVYPYDGQKVFTNFGRAGDRDGYAPETPGPAHYRPDRKPDASYKAGFTIAGKYT